MKQTVLTIFCIALVSCAIQKPVVDELLQPQLFGQDIHPADSCTARDWQDIFVDAPLQQLIADALEHNADVKTMQLALTQADWQLRTARLAYIPSFAIAPGGSVSKVAGGTLSYTYELPLTMQWEINLGGAQTARKEAARYQWMNTKELLHYTQIRLIASVANTYYTLVMQDEQLRLSEQSVQVQQQTVEVMRALKTAGMANELAVNQTEAALQETVTSVSELRLQRDKTIRALNLLLARTPQEINRSAYTEVLPIAIDAAEPVSLDMLAGRPDVRSAEYTLRAAFANTKVARAQFFPTLRLTAGGAWTNNIGEIVNPAQVLLNLIGSLTQPLFQSGQHKADLEIAKATQQQAQIAFGQALLQAGSEVADAMQECQTADLKLHSRQAQVAAAQRAFETSQALLRHASATYLEVLTAQDALLRAEIQSTADRLEAQQGRINLYKAICN